LQSHLISKSHVDIFERANNSQKIFILETEPNEENAKSLLQVLFSYLIFLELLAKKSKPKFSS
jgi:hypothetical protein